MRLNQPIVAAAPARRGCTLLMRDVGRWRGRRPPPTRRSRLDQHTRFLRHMAALHAAFWACGDEFDVVPAMHRYLELSPWMAAAEAAAGSPPLVPRLVAKGWPLLAEIAPAAAAVVTPLARDPGPLLEALATTPQTFVHSNFKLDNLGTDDAGRTVLLDWEQPGRGAPLSDLAWYLAINCRRLPQSKQASIAAYREALEGSGIDTGPWWDRQLALCLLGAMVLFGWEKALGGYDEELACPVAAKNEKIPNGKPWSPGGAPMTLFTEAQLTLGSSTIPVGAYTVYPIPEHNHWTLVVNKNVTPGAAYDEKQDIARTPMETAQVDQASTDLEVAFAHVGARCTLRVYIGKTASFADFNAK